MLRARGVTKSKLSIGDGKGIGIGDASTGTTVIVAPKMRIAASAAKWKATKRVRTGEGMVVVRNLS